MYRLKDTINALYKIRKDMKNQKKAYILIGDYDAEGMAVEAFFDVSEIIKAIKGFLDLEIDKDYLIRCMKPIAMANKICIFLYTHPTEYEGELGETLSDDYLFAEVRQTWERVSNFKIPIICGLMGKEDVVLKYCNMNGEYELEYVPKYEIEGKFEYDCEFIYDRYRKFGAIYYYNVGKIKKVLLEKLIVYNNWKEDYESKQISQLFKTAYTTILAEGLETAEDINFKWNLNESQKIEEILHKVNYNEVQNRRFLVEMNLNLHK